MIAKIALLVAGSLVVAGGLWFTVYFLTGAALARIRDEGRRS